MRLEKLRDEKPGTSCFSRLMSGLPSELKHLTGKEEVGLSRSSAASFWVLLRSLPLITKTFSLRIPCQKPGRLPKGGRQGGPEESVVIVLGQSSGLTGSSTSSIPLGSLVTVEHHRCLRLSWFPLPPSPSLQNGFKMISYKVL